jgi:hypothetical protein
MLLDSGRSVRPQRNAVARAIAGVGIALRHIDDVEDIKLRLNAVQIVVVRCMLRHNQRRSRFRTPNEAFSRDWKKAAATSSSFIL